MRKNHLLSFSAFYLSPNTPVPKQSPKIHSFAKERWCNALDGDSISCGVERSI